MFAREKRASHSFPESTSKKLMPSLEAGSARLPVIQRKTCPCGGGCPRCAAKAGHAGESVRSSPALTSESSQGPADRDSAGSTGFSIQAKLEVGAVDDPLEHEADRVADQVMRMPDAEAMRPMTSAISAKLQRKCDCGGTCEDCRKGDPEQEPGQLHRMHDSGGSAGNTSAPPIVREVLRSPGHALDASTRSLMEQGFGRDFSGVRIHSGERADASARSVGALAYTVGSDITFASGQFNPASAEGRWLLAHELAHVVQQSGSVQRMQRFAECTPARISLEECPPREKGEVERAKGGDMVFLNFHDPIENINGELIANFDIDSSAIKPNLKDTIYWKQFVRKIESNTSHWALVGFTDCEGGEKINLPLRKQRAKAVFDILPDAVKARIDSQEGAPAGQCIRDNTTAGDRTLNRSVLFQYVSSDADFAPEKVASPKRPDIDTKNCSAAQREKLALGFKFAKMMVDRAIYEIDHMKKGSPEEALLIKYFGKDAWDARGQIRRTFRLMQRDWNPDLTFRCQDPGESDCSGGTEGLTGVIPLITGGHVGSLLICDSAFTTKILRETDLSETILHEISHAMQWTFDNGYCDRATGCSMDTEDAVHNADSYSGFSGEVLITRGPA